MSLYGLMYKHWAVVASVACRCPQNVRLVLDDDSEVPCKCLWLGFTGDQQEAWAVMPADGKPVQRSRVVGLEANSVWAGTCIELRGIVDGFVCPLCGRVSYHPDDQRNGYCGACHDVTGRPT